VFGFKTRRLFPACSSAIETGAERREERSHAERGNEDSGLLGVRLQNAEAIPGLFLSD
jgi:hypothetical protein